MKTTECIEGNCFRHSVQVNADNNLFIGFHQIQFHDTKSTLSDIFSTSLLSTILSLIKRKRKCSLKSRDEGPINQKKKSEEEQVKVEE